MIAVDGLDHGLDFADASHLEWAAHCTSMMTFDRRFAALAQVIGEVKVELVSGQWRRCTIVQEESWPMAGKGKRSMWNKSP
jgi:hypothetical protein